MRVLWLVIALVVLSPLACYGAGLLTPLLWALP